jgi:hypothetical protein
MAYSDKTETNKKNKQHSGLKINSAENTATHHIQTNKRNNL